MINLSMLNKIALQRQTKNHTHNRHWCNVWLADVGEKENMCNCHETYPTPHRFSHSRTPWLWGREHLSIWSDHSYKTKGKCIMLFSSQARSYQTSFMGIHVCLLREMHQTQSCILLSILLPLTSIQNFSRHDFTLTKLFTLNWSLPQLII